MYGKTWKVHWVLLVWILTFMVNVPSGLIAIGRGAIFITTTIWLIHRFLAQLR